MRSKETSKPAHKRWVLVVGAVAVLAALAFFTELKVEDPVGSKSQSCDAVKDPNGVVQLARELASSAGLSARFETSIVRAGRVERLLVAGSPGKGPFVYGASIDGHIADVLAAEPSKDASGNRDGGQLLTIALPQLAKLRWSQMGMFAPITLYLVACPIVDRNPDHSAITRATGSENGFVAIVHTQVSNRVLSLVLATALLGALYYVVVACWSAFQQARESGLPRTWNLLKLSAGPTGRASLSNLQLSFFTLVVFWVVAYTLLRTGSWAELSGNVLLLLGIVGGGSTLARLTGRPADLISPTNMAWLRRRGWLGDGNVLAELLSSRGEIDPARLQTIAFGLLVGVALVVAAFNDQTSFGVSDTILGLITASQSIYVAGKLVQQRESTKDGTDARMTGLNATLDAARASEALLVGKATGTDGKRDYAAHTAELEDYLAKESAAASLVSEELETKLPSLGVKNIR